MPQFDRIEIGSIVAAVTAAITALIWVINLHSDVDSLKTSKASNSELMELSGYVGQLKNDTRLESIFREKERIIMELRGYNDRYKEELKKVYEKFNAGVPSKAVMSFELSSCPSG